MPSKEATGRGRNEWLPDGLRPHALDSHDEPEGMRRMVTGDADAMLADAPGFVGVEPLIAYLQQPTIETTLDVQQQFAEDVVSKS